MIRPVYLYQGIRGRGEWKLSRTLSHSYNRHNRLTAELLKRRELVLSTASISLSWPYMEKYCSHLNHGVRDHTLWYIWISSVSKLHSRATTYTDNNGCHSPLWVYQNIVGSFKTAFQNNLVTLNKSERTTLQL